VFRGRRFATQTGAALAAINKPRFGLIASRCCSLFPVSSLAVGQLKLLVIAGCAGAKPVCR
jgi:hypothetical protein